MPELNVQLLEVGEGDSRYWLKFKGRIPTYDYNRIVIFNFCGTELDVKGANIDAEANQILRDKMAIDFGMGPYDISRIRNAFGKIKHYRVQWD